MRSICLNLIVLSQILTNIAAETAPNGQVEIGITSPRNTLSDGRVSSKFQKDLTDSMNYMSESIDRLADNKSKNRAKDMSESMKSAVENEDMMKDSAEYDEEADEDKALDASRDGAELATSSEDTSKYSVTNKLKLDDKERTRALEKDANRKRKAGLSNLENVLDAEEDSEDVAERDEDLQPDDDAINDESDIDDQIEDEVNEATAVTKDVDNKGSKLSKKALGRVEEANIEHLMDLEDCPPGYRLRSSVSSDAQAAGGAHHDLEEEPCPVALADAPCPCILEHFEPLKLEKTQTVSQPEAVVDHNGGGDETGTNNEGLNCEEFMKNVDEQFGDDMESVTHEALKPLSSRLRKGSKAGIRKKSG